MWFDEAREGFSPMATELRVVFGLSGAFILLYVLIGGPIGEMAQAAAGSFY
jgi:NADH-quinone oxidoreductase subunit N